MKKELKETSIITTLISSDRVATPNIADCSVCQYLEAS